MPSYTNNNDVIKAILQKAKKDINGVEPNKITVHGQNTKTDAYYNVWKGNPDWLRYTVRYTNGESEQAKMLTPNLPRYICKTWANNYANEGLELIIPHDESNQRLQEILIENNFKGKFNNFTEAFMGVGSGAIVVNADSFKLDDNGNIEKREARVKINYVGGRRVIPITVDDGEVVECAFITYRTDGATMVIHWLDNNNYYCVTEVKGAMKEGSVVDWKIDEAVTLQTLQSNPLFTFWHPNITDEDEVEQSVGTSIFEGALDSFRQVDLAYTSMWRELKLGQKTKFIATDLDIIDEKGERHTPYDEGDESIISVPTGVDGKAMMNEFNGELRSQALIDLFNTQMNVSAMLCGLGQTQFEFSGQGGRPIQTATGVIAKQTELYRNVVKQENFSTIQLKKMVKAIIFVNNEWTNNPPIQDAKTTEIEITYDDNIVEDTASKRAQDLLEVQNGIMSVAEYRAYWYNEDIDTALSFLQENAMLINTYLSALQTGAMTPEMFVKLVYGDNVEGKEELIAYIQEKISSDQPLQVMDYENE